MSSTASRAGAQRSAFVTWLALATLSLGCASTETSGNENGSTIPASVPGSPFTRRVVAEWEPASGVMVAWPLTVPHRLVVELALDATLHVLVNDEEQIVNARGWFRRWGIDVERVEFLVVPQGDDASWIRDYGPHSVFDENGALWLADARYELATPITGYGCDEPLSTPFNGGWGEDALDYDIVADDAAPGVIAAALGLPHLQLPYALTGGNVLTDGRGLALSSCILVNENREHGIDEAQFTALAGEQLGLTRYTLLSNFEARGIQHVDCLLKVLDERRLLVLRPPRDHDAFPVYEGIVKNELSTLRTIDGDPFQILRVDTARYSGEKLAAYTNALILNGRVHVPLFGIPQDEIALDQWRRALPTHEVVGHTFVLANEPMLSPSVATYGTIGWDAGDALHCRTRAIFDPAMLTIDVEPPTETDGGALLVRATICDHSGLGLDPTATRVVWRVAGQDEWRVEPLERAPTGTFVALIPRPPAGAALEYRVETRSLADRRAQRTRIVPAR